MIRRLHLSIRSNPISFLFPMAIASVVFLSLTNIIIIMDRMRQDSQIFYDKVNGMSFQDVNEILNTDSNINTTIQPIIQTLNETQEEMRSKNNESMNTFSSKQNESQTSKQKLDDLMPLYRRVFNDFQKIRGNVINYEEYANKPSNEISLATYGSNILQNGCNITVQIMDPRVSSYHRGAPIFFALESIGLFIPDACVVISTSKCKVHFQNKNNTRMTIDDVFYQHIYNSSLPLFQGMIKKGQVRVKFLDHTMYNLKSCDNFYNPSAAMMNINYWGGDQFIDGVDSDMVFIMQSDSVMCNEPNMEYLRRFPYIGALWIEYECNLVKKLWNDFTRWPLHNFRDKEKLGLLTEKDRRPDLVNLTSTIEPYCDKAHGIGPVGNGGFSLRSRNALRKVIETCPHDKWSGLDLTNRTFPCMVRSEIAEDLYFATVLRGLNMPIPTAYEAAVFAVERVWPSEVTHRFGGPKTHAEMVQSIRNVMKQVNLAYIKDKTETVPLGFHQVHRFNRKSVTLEGDLAFYCPLNAFIFDPLDMRNKQS